MQVSYLHLFYLQAKNKGFDGPTLGPAMSEDQKKAIMEETADKNYEKSYGVKLLPDLDPSKA